jgi:CheY-like chemotaxis protein
MNKCIFDGKVSGLVSVLIVDDDSACLRVLHRLLSGEFTVAAASSAEEALDMLGRWSFDAVITDYNMPVYGGLWLLGMARELYPSVKRVLISACPPDDLHLHIKDGLVESFLTKPASLQQIADCTKSFSHRMESKN